MSFESLREEVWWANTQLLRTGLVTMHSGNASGIDREHNLVLIKPSGVDYDRLRPEDLSVVDLDGAAVSKDKVPDRISSGLKPSVDTVHHLSLYKNDLQIGGIVHTHSNYATAWAAIGECIPCGLTAIADEFGGDIPCAPYCDNQSENIASGMLAHRSRGPAILLAGHGVFAFDQTPRKALKASIMVEDVAKTMWLARQLGEVKRMPEDEIEKWWSRYHSNYGQ
ncbi:MAG TPA: class II aldolase/adducin family protein [Pyrinomonadaceae bacterium]